MTTAALAPRFYARFAALDRVYGIYTINKSALAAHRAGDKLEGGGNTKHEAVTVELWQQHLAGKIQLGLVPIRDDRTCTWGAIDIDDYGIDHKALDRKIQGFHLPLLICRTKSGGAHLYCFTSEPVAAELMRGKLMEWAVALGHSGVEVFPKQIRLAGPNDYGSWINMPYSGGDKTVRYCIHDGAALSPGDFLDLVHDKYALSEDLLRAIQTPSDERIDKYFTGGPPCLQTIVARGPINELRNQTLFNVIVMLKKIHGDDFKEEMVDQYNQEFFDPPLGHKEIAHMIKSHGKKAYNYKCADEPIRSVCNRQICLTRRYGVGGSDGDPGVVFGQLVKLDTEPPIWLWDVDGERMELTTDEIQNQARFQKRCMETINKWPQTIKAKAWQELVRDRLLKVEIREVPSDASSQGQMFAHLESYCTGRASARTRDELLMNKPWTNREEDPARTYFSGTDFVKHLQQQRMQVTPRQVWAWLQGIDAQHHTFNLKGKTKNVWSVPAFSEQTEDFSVPDMNEEM